MFSISLPMQRMSAHIDEVITGQQSFRHYYNAALDYRIANEMHRSVRVKSSSHNDSQRSISARDFYTTPFVPITESLTEDHHHQLLPSCLTITSRHPSTWDLTNQSSSLTITSRHPSSWDLTNQMVQIVDAVDINNRFLSLDAMRVVDEVEKYRILVVDDSPLNRKMLSKLLKSKGYNIEEAADGQIAVDKIKQEADAGRSYDVILMDFVMPVMDGPTATRAIRAMDILTPVFGLTGRLG